MKEIKYDIIVDANLRKKIKNKTIHYAGYARDSMIINDVNPAAIDRRVISIQHNFFNGCVCGIASVRKLYHARVDLICKKYNIPDEIRQEFMAPFLQLKNSNEI